jgi:hypothetical protein
VDDGASSLVVLRAFMNILLSSFLYLEFSIY